MKKLLITLAAGLLMSCATSYQANGMSGGYSETALAPDVYRVKFRGNGYTSQEQTQDYALLRAADLTLEGGFKYFSVIDESSDYSTSSYTTSGTSTTTGNAYAYGNYANYSSSTTYQAPQTYTFYKPSTGMLIRCYANKPENVFTFDANFIHNSITQKYDIQPSSN